MINGIIYSRDRPQQLRLLLTSIKRNCPAVFDDLTIIYISSDSDFAKGYAKLENEKIIPVTFKQELSLPTDTIRVLDHYNKNNGSFVTFFTDDSVFYRNFNEYKVTIESSLKAGNDIACFSLRLGENTTEQTYYMPGNHVELRATKVGNVVKWKHSDYSPVHGYGYPLSLDGHIYRCNAITDMVRDLGVFQGVNSLEGSLSRYIGRLEPCMVSFDKSVLVTVPINRVQNLCPNQAGVYFGRSPKELNDRYLNNEVIDYDSIDFSIVNSTHNELDYKYRSI